MDKRPITKPSLAQDSAGSCCATRWMGKLPVRCCHIFFLLAGFLVMSLWVAVSKVGRASEQSDQNALS